MKPPVLHVGYPKTATSWLQHQIFPKHPQLRLFSAKSPNSDWIFDLIDDHDWGFDTGRYQACFAEGMQNTPHKQPLVSFELFVGRLEMGGRETLSNAQRLKTVFPEAKIIICLREQRDMLDSMYRHHVARGDTLSIERYLSKKYPAPVAAPFDFLRYEKTIAAYENLFGRDALHICLYEQLKAEPRIFLNELFHFIGVDPLAVSDETIQFKRNAGMSDSGVRVLRYVNYFGRGSARTSVLLPILNPNRTRRWVEKWIDPRLPQRNQNLIPKAFADKIAELYSSGNHILAEKYGLPMEQYGYLL